MTEIMPDVLEGTEAFVIEPTFSRELLDIMPRLRDTAKTVELPGSPEGSSLVALLRCPLADLFKHSEMLEEACRTRPKHRTPQVQARDAMLEAWSNLIALDKLLDPTNLREENNGRDVWASWLAYDAVVDELGRMLVKAMEFDPDYMTCCLNVEIAERRTLRNCTVAQRTARVQPAFIQPPAKTVSLTDPPARGKAAAPASASPKSTKGPVAKYLGKLGRRPGDVDDSHKRDGC